MPACSDSDLREFERFYGCPVEFNAPTGQLVFSDKTLALPLSTRDPRLLETLRPFCEAAARARNTPVGSLRAAVEDEVQRQLPHGRVSAPTVAKVLALGVRSLSRRLSEEGTTFVEVVDQMRHSLALQYLKEPGFASAQIAWLLGYEGRPRSITPSGDGRATRRWRPAEREALGANVGPAALGSLNSSVVTVSTPSPATMARWLRENGRRSVSLSKKYCRISGRISSSRKRRWAEIG